MKYYTIPPNDLYSMAAKRLLSVVDGYISHDQSVIIFLSGGSAVRLYPYVVDWIKEHLNRSFKGKLALALVDERFQPGRERVEEVIIGHSPDGHRGNPEKRYGFRVPTTLTLRRVNKPGMTKREIMKDSNAVVIGQTGLWRTGEEKGISSHLISQSGTLEESASLYNQTISNLLKSASKTVAVLGIGQDGHTAGLLPGYRKEWDVDQLVVGYKNDGPFPQRISLTPKVLLSIDFGLVVAAGEKKRPVLKRLRSGEEIDINLFPAATVCEMKEVEICTDF